MRTSSGSSPRERDQNWISPFTADDPMPVGATWDAIPTIPFAREPR
jgi:hypothetical protein